MFLAGPILDAVDTNQDNKADATEIVAGAAKLFVQFDAEKAGSLDEKGIAAGLGAILPHPPGANVVFRGEGRPPEGPGAFFAPALMAKADADKDGKVTEQEFMTLARTLTKEWDKDKNGTLDEAEIAGGLSAALPNPMFRPREEGPPR
jgi:hypothetical protein